MAGEFSRSAAQVPGIETQLVKDRRALVGPLALLAVAATFGVSAAALGHSGSSAVTREPVLQAAGGPIDLDGDGIADEVECNPDLLAEQNASLLGNGSFEEPAAAAGQPETLIAPGALTPWQSPDAEVALVPSGGSGGDAPDGNQYLSMGSQYPVWIYQDLTVPASWVLVYRWKHQRLSGQDSLKMEIGDSSGAIWASALSPATGTSWQTVTGHVQLPTGETAVRFGFRVEVGSGGGQSGGNLLDDVEFYLCPDTDTGGAPDIIDLDSDNDLILDAEELTADPDLDGRGNYIDRNSDHDSISDEIEGDADADQDGIPNYLDHDSDGDGLPDGQERDEDTDDDGIANYLDLDSDGDGIPDEQDGPSFLLADVNGDGIPDGQNADSDVDGDGIPDWRDGDADGDGVPDVLEGDGDIDGDGVPDRIDGTDDRPTTTTAPPEPGLRQGFVTPLGQPLALVASTSKTTAATSTSTAPTLDTATASSSASTAKAISPVRTSTAVRAARASQGLARTGGVLAQVAMMAIAIVLAGVAVSALAETKRSG